MEPAQGYAGDISPQPACRWWQAGEAVLVDVLVDVLVAVRSDAEREWVGVVPGAIPLAWKQWPGMVMNATFDEDLVAAVPADKKVVLLCRSGARSIAAAKRAAAHGTTCSILLQELAFAGLLHPEIEVQDSLFMLRIL